MISHRLLAKLCSHRLEIVVLVDEKKIRISKGDLFSFTKKTGFPLRFSLYSEPKRILNLPESQGFPPCAFSWREGRPSSSRSELISNQNHSRVFYRFQLQFSHPLRIERDFVASFF